MHRKCVKSDSSISSRRYKSAEAIAAVNYQFYKIAKMPLVIGVIDGTFKFFFILTNSFLKLKNCMISTGTHIPIENPGGDSAELFRNRKGFFSINTQVVVDSSMKIIDIVARYVCYLHLTRFISPLIF